jgi:hypothetical protein
MSRHVKAAYTLMDLLENLKENQENYSECYSKNRLTLEMKRVKRDIRESIHKEEKRRAVFE